MREHLHGNIVEIRQNLWCHDLRGRIAGDQPAVAQSQDAVAELGGYVQIMNDQSNANAAPVNDVAQKGENAC